MDYDDPNDMWMCWKNIFLSVADKHAPSKRKRIKNKKSPWINGNIRKQIIEKDSLKKAAIKSNDPVDWANYKRAENATNNEIKKTKACYYHNPFAENFGNSREIWKTINQVMSCNTKKDNNITSIKTEGCSISDTKQSYIGLKLFSFPAAYGMADQMDQILAFAFGQMLGEIGSRGRNPRGKYMPVVFNEEDWEYVPSSLRGFLRYNWPKHQTRMIRVMNGRANHRSDSSQ